MTVTAKTLLEATAIPAAATAQYTAPPNTRTIIDKMTATNTTAGALTFTTYLVASGGATGAGTRIIAAQSVAAGAAYLCPEIVGHILNAGDAIYTEASGAGFTVRISGREVS